MTDSARIWREEVERLNGVLNQIGDLAHDNSTGPAVPDLLWDIRAMAYEGISALAEQGPNAAEQKSVGASAEAR